ncbi:MFS transporter [Gordonia amicalis]|uniref:MFS transporter n=1 Tax=Gordonia amicalis TaxID=89053 RepID=UPI00041B887E|nr:MFS transporter [Gordonia amicalis]MCZ0914743.1 MFS transporter [Gordonia amicalis]MCZ4578737.1 MFS transporter [Gordonia amicalis]MCZ4651431.1 MFS transporter [Gordonia amicalis]
MPAERSTTQTSILPIIFALSLAFTITAVDPLVLSLNLPQVSRELDVPPTGVGLLGGMSTLVMAASVLGAGNLGDSIGLRRLLMSGLAVVAVADVLAMLSPGYGFLLAMRVVAGLGMAALLGVSLALLKTSVTEEQRPKAIGIFVAIEMVLCGVLPALTGWAVTGLGWRLVFLVAPLLAVVSMLLTARFVPESPRQERAKLDVIGIVLIGVALLTLVIGLAAAQNGMLRPQTWLPLLVSVVGAVLFVRHERRTPEPALDLSLFGNRTFTVALAAAFTLNFLIAGLSIVLGQYGSKVLALSPRTVGLLFLPGSLLIAGALIMSGSLMEKFSPRPVMVAGLATMAAAGLLMAGTVNPTMALWLLVMAVWLYNLGSMVSSTSVSETVLSHAPSGQSGTVASVQTAFGMTGYAFGPTVYLLLLNAFFNREWLADTEQRGLTVTQGQEAVDAARSAVAQSPGGVGYDPNLLQQVGGLDLGADFSGAVRLTMLTVSVLPIAVALGVLRFRHERPARAA